MSTKHNAVTRVIHWITVAMVIAAFALGPEDIDEMNNPNLEWGVQVHETLGLLVLGLSVLRIFWMFFTEKPTKIAMPRVMQIGSRAVQGVFYLLLLSVPATAILGVWLEGDSLALVQNTAWASPFNTHESLGEFLLDTHPALANVLIWLAGFHAAAALFHHYFLKDDVLKSMLPK
jgi:cytochrome b561